MKGGLCGERAVWPPGMMSPQVGWLCFWVSGSCGFVGFIVNFCLVR